MIVKKGATRQRGSIMKHNRHIVLDKYKIVFINICIQKICIIFLKKSSSNLGLLFFLIFFPTIRPSYMTHFWMKFLRTSYHMLSLAKQIRKTTLIVA